jgi:membrane protein involved in colicin uptake
MTAKKALTAEQAAAEQAAAEQAAAEQAAAEQAAAQQAAAQQAAAGTISVDLLRPARIGGKEIAPGTIEVDPEIAAQLIRQGAATESDKG